VKDDFDVEEDVLAEEEEDYESILFDDAEIEEPVKEYSCPPAVPGSPVKYQKKNRIYSVPTENLLTTYPDGEYWIIDKDTQDAAALLKETLSEFRIQAEVTGIRKGPVITMFEILPAPGVKLSKIVALQDNIALRLAASSVRIVAPIPGKSAVGIEVPNRERAIVSFKELIEADNPAYKKMNIPVILGKDITGEGQFLDLTKTPHLLIAGSTGSGKSVCVNTMILSILYKRSPQEVKMILIDPKVVELKLYNDIPHLLTPVITEPKKAFQALQYCLCEMERRYALLDGMGVREISSYNRRIIERNIATEKLPYIVVVIDEFADLMATTGKELESTVARLAAMSRAVGIHLVLATQRPSIDVITGLIKANIPTRIAFMVASKMDSRIIIDQVGAEKLLGKGDMLYASATDPFPIRIQGTFVSDSEVENVVEYVKTLGEPEYIDEEIFVEDEDDISIEPGLFGDGDDPLYDKALEIVIQAGKASASYIQRRLKIGYNRAARLVEDMEARGIVGPANGSKPREIVHIP
ncbi:MAG TPA: DNA translocase FtsK, partial [Treponemataceae bacterium]|nr:DNA translocase FtsK [Treponemataceae bacterium]